MDDEVMKLLIPAPPALLDSGIGMSFVMEAVGIAHSPLGGSGGMLPQKNFEN